MKIIYDPTSGEIFTTVLDKDLIIFSHTINVPIAELSIDEITENQNVILDLHRSSEKLDVNGLQKYHIQNGELHIRDNWKEVFDV